MNSFLFFFELTIKFESTANKRCTHAMHQRLSFFLIRMITGEVHTVRSAGQCLHTKVRRFSRVLLIHSAPEWHEESVRAKHKTEWSCVLTCIKQSEAKRAERVTGIKIAATSEPGRERHVRLFRNAPSHVRAARSLVCGIGPRLSACC